MNKLIVFMLFAMCGCVLNNITVQDRTAEIVAPVMPDLGTIKFIEIRTAEEFMNIRDGLDKSYRLMNDIDLSGYIYNWEPIASEVPFSGVFDGNAYIITGFVVSAHNRKAISLFGKVKEGVIMNLTLKNIRLLSSVGAAGFVNSITNGFIINCHVSGTLQGGDGSGGIVGMAHNSVISDSSSSLNLITMKSYNYQSLSGGIAGIARYSEINNCYSTGNVTEIIDQKYFEYTKQYYKDSSANGYSEIGGIVGYVNHSILRNVYSIGNISGSNEGFGNYVGGIVGVLNNSEIKNAYSTGDITGQRSVGGIAGIASDSTIINAYSEGKIHATLNGAGAITGSIYKTDLVDVARKRVAPTSTYTKFAGDKIFGIKRDKPYAQYRPSW